MHNHLKQIPEYLHHLAYLNSQGDSTEVVDVEPRRWVDEREIYHDLDLSCANLTKVVFSNMNFRNINFRSANLTYAKFDCCEFENCDFFNVTVDNTELIDVNFNNCSGIISCNVTKSIPLYLIDTLRGTIVGVKDMWRTVDYAIDNADSCNLKWVIIALDRYLKEQRKIDER